MNYKGKYSNYKYSFKLNNNLNLNIKCNSSKMFKNKVNLGYDIPTIFADYIYLEAEKRQKFFMP